MSKDRVMNGPTHEAFVREHLPDFFVESAYLSRFGAVLGIVSEAGLVTNYDRLSVAAEAVALVARVKRFGVTPEERTARSEDPIGKATENAVRFISKKSGFSEKNVEKFIGAMADVINDSIDRTNRAIVSSRPAQPRV